MKNRDKETVENTSLQDVKIIELTPENCRFREKDGVVSLEQKHQNETLTFRKVTFRRSFPFEHPFSFISVLDEEEHEVGFIEKVEDFLQDGDIIKLELSRRYYEPKIKAVSSLKERYGFSYWKVVLDDDTTSSFTMQDTFSNIIRVGENKAILLDVDGNRFVIEDLSKLDKRSLKKIELYL